MNSRDVIHAFWIPAFRLQEDVVPGITTHYRATPDRLGSYPVVCNLLCGLGHSLMRSTVHVVTPEAFHAWIRAQRDRPPAPAAASATLHRYNFRIMWGRSMTAKGREADGRQSPRTGVLPGRRADGAARCCCLGGAHMDRADLHGPPHLHHFISANAITTVSLITVPLAFLVGIGGFDYWFYWADRPPDAARRTTPATAPTPGRTTSGSTPTTR